MHTPSWIADQFANPPASDRPQPQWVLNGALDHERLDCMLAQFAEQGCGGVFFCARSGMMAPYLGEEWLETWRRAVAKAAELGLGCQIYDEYICPAGYGGGEVIAADPGLIPIMLEAQTFTGGQAPRDCRMLVDPASGARRPASEASAEHPLLALCERPLPGSPGLANLPYPDTAAVGSGSTFLEQVHERYRQATPDALGDTVRFAFCDEPSLPNSRDAALYSPQLRQAFQAAYGYELAERVHLLFVDGEGAAALRHDYQLLCQRLFNERLFAPLADWCAQHGLQLTGHVNEHHWPEPMGLPSAMAALRHFQAPGTDLLAFQFFPDQPDFVRTRKVLLNQRELDSVRKQCGREVAMTETCGGGGYDYGLREMKPLEDCALALGVNLLDPHIADSTLAGHGKYDWPQTISDHAPWFADYRRQCDHTARVVCALRQGRNRHRLLVLQPTTTAWCRHRIGGEPLEELLESQLALMEALDAGQVDYDLGDEQIMAELGRVDGDRLEVGDCAYEALLLPAACDNLERSTVALIEAWLAAGGRVFTDGAPPSLVDGRPSSEPAQLVEQAGWQAFETRAAMIAALRGQLPPRISAPDGGPLPAGLLWRLSEGEEGSVLFCCNPWSTPWRARIRLPASRALELRSDRGDAWPLALDDACLDLELPPAGHKLLYLSDRLPATATILEQPDEETVDCRLLSVEAEQPNIAVLDYADLMVGGRHWPADCVTRQDERLWQALGVVHSAKPFRDRHLTRHIPAEAVEVGYRVMIDGHCDRAGLDLLIERPWLWEISVDGRPIDQTPGEAWFDHDWRRIPIGHVLRPGGNRIALRTPQCLWWHNPMPVYLLGDVALAEAEAGWQIVAPQALHLGDCGPQGRPCYPWGLRYRFAFTLAADTPQLRIALGDWSGSIVRCRLDGETLGSIVFDHDSLLTEAVVAGEHELELSLQGHLGNMMGPHHLDGLPGRWNWLHVPEGPQPAGSAYRRKPVGLMEPPHISRRG